jgi:uncharacterized membrane protein
MAIAFLAWVVAIPLLGGLTGLRTMTPMAILCWFAWMGHLDVEGTWAFWSAMHITAIIFSVLAVGELIGDKLPMTPSRVSAFPLIARIGFGALVGAIAATGLQGQVIEGVLLGSISAIAGAFLGFHLRQTLVKDWGLPDLGVALVEDGLAIGLAVIAMGIITG